MEDRDWRRANTMGKTRVKGVKQPEVTEEILEQINKQLICKLLEDNGNNQCGFTKPDRVVAV